MKAPVFFLADQAVAHKDGKFYVIGGFLRSIDAPFLPFEYPHLSLCVRVEFDRDEASQTHLIEIHSNGPGNRGFAKPYSLRYLPTVSDSDESSDLQFVYHMDAIPFAHDGVHSLALLVDDQQITGLDFEVRLSSEPLSRETSYATQLQAAVDAFSAGDSEGAEETFRRLTAEFPFKLDAVNNLAFVRLSLGKASEAQEAFLHLEKLGFDRPDILEANLACCEYLLGRYTNALARFDRCLRELTFPGPAILFGIEDNQLFPVNLDSASDYLALMLLNATWCSFRGREPDLAKEFARRASEFELFSASLESGLPTPSARSLALVRKKLGRSSRKPG